MADKESNRTAVEQFLEELGDITGQEEQEQDAQTRPDQKELLSFLDELASTTKEPSESQESAPVATPSTPSTQPQEQAQPVLAQEMPSWRSWGTSIWTQASQAVKTTTEQLAQSDYDLTHYVNKERLEQLSQNFNKLTTTILETVAPLHEHEVVEVWIQHGMVGYIGIESLVYRAFNKVMDQTEAGEVVVRKVKHTEAKSETGEKRLDPIRGLEEANKTCMTTLQSIVVDAPASKTHYTPSQGAVPITTCPVFLAIQPCLINLGHDHLVYVMQLQDPTHQLHFQTVSQSIPGAWLEVPYEENEWVEEKMVEVIKGAVVTLAQDYVWTRMKGQEDAQKRHEEEKQASTTEAEVLQV